MLPSRRASAIIAPPHAALRSHFPRAMADNEDGDVTIEAAKATETKELSKSDLQYVQYEPSKEEQYLPAIRQLISKDLSEPYSIYVYRYFLYQWGDLCYMVLICPRLFSKHLNANFITLGSLPHQHLNRRNHMQARTTPQRHLPRLHRHARNTRRIPRPRHSHATRPTGH
jgi:hypothetical protein